MAADPVHLMYVLERQVEKEQFPAEIQDRYISFIKEYLSPRYVDFIGKEIQTAYLESYSEYGQNLFDRYVTMLTSGFRIRNTAIRKPALDRAALNSDLEKIEKAAGISNPKDFQRNRQLRAARPRQ
ncbi:MAG: hypothetical protein R3E95_21870 [Thiolinea sp.]